MDANDVKKLKISFKILCNATTNKKVMLEIEEKKLNNIILEAKYKEENLFLVIE